MMQLIDFNRVDPAIYVKHRTIETCVLFASIVCLTVYTRERLSFTLMSSLSSSR